MTTSLDAWRSMSVADAASVRMPTLAASATGTSSLGYDAVDDVKNRKMSSPTTRSEDVVLNTAMRDQLVAQANDAMRNFSLFGWTIRKHLDFVASFTFSAQTKSNFDNDLQRLMEQWSNEPTECDIMGRHTLDRIVRMTEARSVIAGDHLLLMLSSGHLQQVETDRLRSELGGEVSDLDVHGVRLNAQGRALAYKVWKRERYGGYTDPRDIPAAGAIFHAQYPSYRSDQVRGISPMTAGLNDFIDAYEWKELTKATAKLRSAFGIIVTSALMEGLGNHEVTEEPEVAEGDETTEQGAPKYEVELGKGPFKLELEEGEDLKFVTDSSPSVQTFEFFTSTIGFALKALDIPMSFAQEDMTNFFGMRSALILYLKSCQVKRRNLVQNVLNPVTRWKIVQWIAQGRLKLPANGDINNIPFAWHPAGTPYWNPSQEINGDIQAIQSGLGNWEDIYLERTGRDWFADMLRLREQQLFLEENGIALDPKVIQFLQIATDPSLAGDNPLASLPKGVLAT